MGDLKAGETLLLADDSEAEVVSLREEHAPAGKTFTTYNFEVADWHTYFVAPAGSGSATAIWVHNQCGGDDTPGLRFVEENLGTPRNSKMQAARDFEAATNGAMSDLASQKKLVPALEFDNPNPRGNDFVKFDGFDELPDGRIELIDAKTRVVPFSTRNGPFISSNVRDGLVRKSLAIDQNPGFRAVLEFPHQAARREAQLVLRQLGITNISTRVRL